MLSFIGNPGGVNRFDEDAVVNGISGWTGTLTPEQIAQLPWNAGVQPAGGAFDLPGGNPQAAIDFQESTGGVDPNIFREEMNLAVAGLTGLPGGVPAKAVKRIQSGYQAAIPRYIEVVQSGRPPKEAEAIVFDPLRNEAKSLFAEYKYRQPAETSPKLLTDLAAKQLADLYSTRRQLNSDLYDPKKMMSRAKIQAQLDSLNGSIKAIESNAGGSPAMAGDQSSEVARRTKDGRMAIFDATTKQFLRYQ